MKATQEMRMFRLRGLRLTLFSIFATGFPAGLFGLNAAKAQTPEAIVKKVDSAYRNAKTFDCSFSMKQSVRTTEPGKSVILNSQNRYKYHGPSQFYLELKANPTGRTITQISVSNGKTLYVYVPERKLYKKGAAPASVRTPFGLFRSMIPDPKKNKLTMKAATTINGKAVYVIDVSSLAEPKPGQPKVAATLYIDKTTSALLRFSSTGGSRSLEMTVAAIDFKPNFPASAFEFTPPSEAKEFTGAPMTPTVPRKTPKNDGAPNAPVAPHGSPGSPKQR